MSSTPPNDDRPAPQTGSSTVEPTPVPDLLRNAGLVFVGGALGALTRGFFIALYPADAASWTVLAINLVGSFVFAWLATALLARHRRILLFFGTGFLGGFTTYSTLALDLASRTVAGDYLGLTLLTVFSLAGGVALARIGWMLGRSGSGGHGTGGRPGRGPGGRGPGGRGPGSHETGRGDHRGSGPDLPPTVPGGTAVAP